MALVINLYTNQLFVDIQLFLLYVYTPENTFFYTISIYYKDDSF
jgi:hypothetical protein